MRRWIWFATLYLSGVVLIGLIAYLISAVLL
ncbi:MAG: DUF2474 domain-containing protein [Paracoccus sp. (in: a-proteobacteria)]|nr:DUF2474 domain-containing protein [Paracoccus sp. (in: a-proteobacteria)]